MPSVTTLNYSLSVQFPPGTAALSSVTYHANFVDNLITKEKENLVYDKMGRNN